MIYLTKVAQNKQGITDQWCKKSDKMRKGFWIWKFEDLKIWKFENVEIWRFENLKIWEGLFKYVAFFGFCVRRYRHFSIRRIHRIHRIHRRDVALLRLCVYYIQYFTLYPQRLYVNIFNLPSPPRLCVRCIQYFTPSSNAFASMYSITPLVLSRLIWFVFARFISITWKSSFNCLTNKIRLLNATPPSAKKNISKVEKFWY